MSEPVIELTPIQSREQEIANYQGNIVMFESMRANLPAEWPTHLEQYRDIPRTQHHAAIATVTDMDDVILLSDLWARMHCDAMIRTETLEMRKSMAILAALLESSTIS